MFRAMIALTFAFLLALPAHASDSPRESDRVPVLFDIATRVGFGIPLTIAGAAAMVPVGLATLVTRPSEIDKPFDALVMGPVRYTWIDPLGYHPAPGERRAAPHRTRVARRPMAGDAMRRPVAEDAMPLPPAE